MPKKKKSPPTSVQDYIRWLARSPVHLTNIFVFSIIAVALPGQNLLQTITLSPQAPKIRSFPVDITFDMAVPVRTKDLSIPTTSAKAIYILEPHSAAVLFQDNSTSRLLPASTTKIMTALVALDEFPLNGVITIGTESDSIGHTSNLFRGEQLYVSDVLKAMLISSGNDAALALAQHHPLGYDHFISLMNQKATELHLTDTNYSNVSGVETPGHYTTVKDLAVLTKYAMDNQFFREVVGTKSTSITDITGQYSHRLDNINQLLENVEGVAGVKTGWTQNAGECLVTYTLRDGKPLITVVLGSNNRFGDSEALIEWAYNTHEWVEVNQLLKTITQ